jgi:hypothetical protein
MVSQVESTSVLEGLAILIFAGSVRTQDPSVEAFGTNADTRRQS